MTDRDEDTLCDDLLRPEAYPAPRPRAVSLAATHASWVFLTDDEVWKLKRPVDYGFLDFSTVERRERFCHEEVRLGRRLAPDVYLGVAPVRFGPGGHTFVGPGATVDWAVHMRRLPDDRSAAARLQAGRLDVPTLRRFADRLAAFYADAPATPRFGSPALLAENVQENHQQTLPYVGRFVDPATVDRLWRWQQGALASLEVRLHERVAAGRIREGHGDLRLEHVYFMGPQDDPVVIDAIDFNESFRCLDVALDAAFFAMELDAAGRTDLAAAFVSAFAAATDDHDLYPVLDLYCSYRAWVRAKVACFVAADPGTPPDKARRKADEAARLFAVADGYRQPRRRPAVVAVGGLIGAGKSTLAEALCPRLEMPVLSADLTRKRLAGLRPTDRGPAALYDEAATRRTFDELFRRAEEVLGSGRGIILDTTFSEAATRQRARSLAAAAGVPFLFVEARCDEATLRARLRARAGAACVSDAREDLLPSFLARYQPVDELPASERLVVDTGRDLDEVMGAVTQRLGAAS